MSRPMPPGWTDGYPPVSFKAEFATNLRLEFFLLPVIYRVPSPLSEAEHIIIAYLLEHEQKITELDLAGAFGIAVADDTGRQVYRDIAEIQLFEGILGGLFDFSLLERKNGHLQLTGSAAVAVETGKKYLYYSGQVAAHKVVELAVTDDFNFHSLGLPAVLRTEEDFLSAITLEPSNDILLARIQEDLELSEPDTTCELLNLGDPYGFRPLTIPVTYYFNGAEISVFRNDEKDLPLTESIALDGNEPWRKALILDAAYQQLVADTSVFIQKAHLLAYAGKWQFSDLFRQQRLDWQDDGVVSFLIDQIGPGDRAAFTQEIPLGLLKKDFASLVAHLDWTIVSSRLDDDFILTRLIVEGDKGLKYPWDFRVLSNRTVGFMDQALWKTAQHIRNYEGEYQWEDFNWNWLSISGRLLTDDILRAFPLMPFDRKVLSERDTAFLEIALSEDTEDHYEDWDWPVVQTKLSPVFLFTHLVKFSPFFDWNSLASVVLAGDYSWPEGASIEAFIEVMLTQSYRIRPFAHEPLLWSEDLIDLLDAQRLIRWSSTISQPGFEVSAQLSWDDVFFDKYHSRIKTAIGKLHLSKVITSLVPVVDHPDFGWHWLSLSANTALAWPASLLVTFGSQLDWPALLGRMPLEELKNALSTFDRLGVAAGLPVRQKIWNYFNDILPVEELLAYSGEYPEQINLRRLSERNPDAILSHLLRTEDFTSAWDWQLLAGNGDPAKLIAVLPALNQYYFLQRRHLDLSFISEFWRAITLKLSLEYIVSYALTFRNDWDWEYLSRVLPMETIMLCMEEWQHKLDWQYLTIHRFSKQELTESLLTRTNISGLLYWPHIVEFLLSADELSERLVELAAGINSSPSNAQVQAAWSVITQRLPVETIFPELENKIAHTATQLRQLLHFDWKMLSGDERLSPYLTIRFVKVYEDFWEWGELSKNTAINENWSYLRQFRARWDWSYLSRYSWFIKPRRSFRDSQKIYQEFQHDIDWQALSLRQDMRFEQELLLRYRQENWDWKALSGSPKLDVDAALLKRLPDKPWDWQLFSANPALTIDNEFIAAFKDKKWDWTALSLREDLLPSAELYEALPDKPWDYAAISKRVDFGWTPALFKLLGREALDWQFISSRATVYWDKHTLEVLRHRFDWNLLSSNLTIPLDAEWFAAFVGDWDFNQLSQRPDLTGHLNLLLLHINSAWDWAYLSAREDLYFGGAELKALADKLSWEALSRREWKRFECEWLDTFRGRWDWIALSENYVVMRDAEQAAIVESVFAGNLRLNFCRHINRQHSKWKGFVYHFAHLTNAAKIILQGEILSRERAEKSTNVFVNAAGNVVARRDEAHHYARFYFRPQTPTQFYNEMLGTSLHSRFYGRARSLGSPKCPVPVFFRFPLQEVLNSHTERCFVSNGNMQTNWARVFPVKRELIEHFDFDYVYSTFDDVFQQTKYFANQGYDFQSAFRQLLDRHQTASQQEFLVRDVFQLNKIKGMEIIVPDENARLALLQLIGEDHPFATQVIVNNSSLGMFHYQNSSTTFTFGGDELFFSTGYDLPHELVFESEQAGQVEIMDGYPLHQGPKQLSANRQIRLKINLSVPFTLKFRDEKRQEWVIFDYQKPLRSSNGD